MENIVIESLFNVNGETIRQTLFKRDSEYVLHTFINDIERNIVNTFKSVSDARNFMETIQTNMMAHNKPVRDGIIVDFKIAAELDMQKMEDKLEKDDREQR